MSATPKPAASGSNTRVVILAAVAGIALVGLVVSQFVLGGDDEPAAVGVVATETSPDAAAPGGAADLTDLDDSAEDPVDGAAEPAAVPPVDGPARNVFLPLGEPADTGAAGPSEAELADPQG